MKVLGSPNLSVFFHRETPAIEHLSFAYLTRGPLPKHWCRELTIFVWTVHFMFGNLDSLPPTWTLFPHTPMCVVTMCFEKNSWTTLTPQQSGVEFHHKQLWEKKTKYNSIFHIICTIFEFQKKTNQVKQRNKKPSERYWKIFQVSKTPLFLFRGRVFVGFFHIHLSRLCWFVAWNFHAPRYVEVRYYEKRQRGSGEEELG